MHGWSVLAFLLLGSGSVLAAFNKAYVAALACCGLAVELVPTVFNLTN